MKVRAVAKGIGVSASKVRTVLDLIRGKQVDEALSILKYTSTPTAKVVTKVVKSAAANAENNFQLLRQDLKIASIFADGGPMMKRFRARSRGQASPILKRTSRITVIVGDEES
ncbi:MAG: 50S ribosomal protein L22 [Chloroflexi bacterium]|nr:50S ribosomal protein L22 [Chloroflexota bacterium]